ncbi:MAG: molybdate ABC transporter permease subunit [Crocinitomicaceae bacterium]|nr:molybdate ABC transporter permease subunit [Crocinitomicaceae bacterium]
MFDWSPIFLSLELALCTTLILLLIAIPLGYWLSKSNSLFKPVVEAIVSLPLILPPTVIGFYLLISFSPESAIGSFFNNTLGLQLAFSFPGLVIGSIIYSLPFMVHPVANGFSSLPPSLAEASFTMGKSKFQTLRKIELPNIKNSILTGIVLTFAHTIGEFGVVLMIGGNIPDETRVLSIDIYSKVESLDYQTAHQYSGMLLGIMFLILLLVYFRRQGNKNVLL